MLKTELCARLGIEHPILSAGFGPGAGPEVVAAVSNAGGCGVLGASGFRVPYVRELIRRVRALTSKPFGVNLILEDIEEGPIEACLDERVPLLVFFWGDPAPYVGPAHARGVKVAIQVGSAEEAREAAEAGVDFVIAQGVEAGGHVRGTTALSVLVPAVVDVVAPLPVLASGGVADGRGLVAALSLGAQGGLDGHALRRQRRSLRATPVQGANRQQSGGGHRLHRGPLRRWLAERAASRPAQRHRSRMGGRGKAAERPATR